MQTHNNWMTYSFGNEVNSPKRFSQDVFKLNIEKQDKDAVIPNYYDALLLNATRMRDEFNEPFDVCFSGGIDSEIVLRVFKDAGIAHNTFIFQYENDLNVRDVVRAVDFCESYNIDYKIININLSKFFANEAEQLYSKVWCPKVSRLPLLKFLDYLDNIPIFCDFQPRWHRRKRNNFSESSDWLTYFNEDSFSLSMYANLVNRPLIGQWFLYSPEVTLAFNNLAPVKRLLRDEFDDKTSSVLLRTMIHQDFWPDLQPRYKLKGYESIEGNYGSVPKFMVQFYLNHVKFIENTKYLYTQDEFESLIYNYDTVLC
jgi:hypothetical protein